MNFWWPTIFAISLLGAITFVYRFSFISSRGRSVAEKIPREFLQLLAPATFTAIIVNNLLATIDPEEFRRRLIVAAASLVVAYFTRQIVSTLVFGLIFLAILQQAGF